MLKSMWGKHEYSGVWKELEFFGNGHYSPQIHGGRLIQPEFGTEKRKKGHLLLIHTSRASHVA